MQRKGLLSNGPAKQIIRTKMTSTEINLHGTTDEEAEAHADGALLKYQVNTYYPCVTLQMLLTLGLVCVPVIETKSILLSLWLQ
jgi:hypothetical protein